MTTTPAELREVLAAVERAARPLKPVRVVDDDAPGVYDEHGALLVPYDAPAPALDVAYTLLHAVVAVPELAMALARVAALHRPVHVRYTREQGTVVEDVCPDCLGGMLAEDPLEQRECGCWGMSVAYCAACATVTAGGRLVPAAWPCASWMPLDRLVAWSQEKMPAEVGGEKVNVAGDAPAVGA